MKTEYAKRSSTAKGREELAKAVELLAEQSGAKTERGPKNTMERNITLYVIVGSYRCMMHFCGESNVGAFLGHWHMGSDAPHEMEYPEGFASAIRGSVNPHHRRKATSCEETFDGHLRVLASGIEKLKLELGKQCVA